MLYSVESLEMSESMKRELEAAEMRLSLRITKILWTELKSNEKALRMVREKNTS